MNTTDPPKKLNVPPVQKLVIVACVLLTTFIWLADAVFEYLWLHDAQGSFLPNLLPLHSPHEMQMRILYSSVLVFAGIAVGGALQRLVQQQRETALVAENLRITLDSIGDAVIATDSDGRVSRMNPLAQTLTGWSIEEAYLKPLTEVFVIVNAHTRQPAFNPVNHVLTTGQIVGLANDTLLLGKDGKERQIADSAAPIQEGDGAISGVILVFRDVSDEYRIRCSMERTNALLTAVVEQAHIPIALASADQGQILMINEACLAFLGICREDAMEEKVADFARLWSNCTSGGMPLTVEKNPLVQSLQGGATQGLEITITSADGLQRHAIAEGVPIRNDEGMVIAGLLFLIDTTERRAMEEERRKMQRLESIGTLAGGIAHDFNNILMGIFGGIELAKLTLPPDHESYRYIETAHQSLDRATHLTNQLLTFAKGGEPMLEAVRLPSLLRESVHFNLTGSNIKAHFDVAPDLLPIHADKGQISHVLANLIINAKQAMPNGGNLFIAAENVVGGPEHSAITQRSDWVRLTIRDEGIGMTEKVREKIFDPYFTTKQSGSGLGLAIVHSIITKHKARIQVDSTPDVGTTFTLYLPADKNTYFASESWNSSDDVPYKRGRVLIMDDEGMIRDIASEMLTMLGFEADEAISGEEALEKYAVAVKAGQPYVCVIMDLTIPGGMGGKEAIAALLSRFPDAVAVVASGYSNDPVMADYAAYGFKGRLIKPFQIKQLRQEMLRITAA